MINFSWYKVFIDWAPCTPSTIIYLSVVQTEAIACAHIVSSVVQSVESQREWLARGLRFNNIIRKFCSCVSKTRTKKEVTFFNCLLLDKYGIIMTLVTW